MKRTYVKLLTVAGLTGCFLFTSCRSAQETTARYEISKVEGNMITIDSTWDANPDKKATTVLKPYKDKVDAMMYEVIGIRFLENGTIVGGDLRCRHKRIADGKNDRHDKNQRRNHCDHRQADADT